MMKKIAILEPGAWGTALGIILSKEKEVNFWYASKKLALKILENRENERLPGVKIPKEITIFSNLKKAIENSDLIIVASPSFSFRKTVLKIKNIKNLPPLLGIAKGIEKDTLFFPSNIVYDILKKKDYGHLSGPGFAKKVATGTHAQEVIACSSRALLKRFKELFKIHPLKPSVTTDLIGVELAGAAKNALSIGISLVEASVKGPKIEKIKKDLISLGVKEMIKIGQAMGAKKETFLGPAGKGDLILTATNPLSRNFQFGKNLLHDSERMRKKIKEGSITVEGFNNAFALYKLGKIYKVDLPMINEIYKVIYRKISPHKTVKDLIALSREK
jgi:glycerol-3-phosphate dehydrogenase (NAD(P)+)